MGLTTVAVGLRFYARKKRNLPLRIDDWLAVFAVVSQPGSVLEMYS